MSKVSRFFRYIWRINAVLLLFTGLLATAAGGVLIYSTYEYFYPAAEPYYSLRGTTYARIDEQPEPAKSVRLGAFQQLRGIPEVIAPFGLIHTRPVLSSQVNTAEVVDYLVVNSVQGTSWWLRGKETGVVLRRWDIAEDDAAPVSLIAVSVIPADSNGDGKYSSGDERHFILAKPDGSAKVMVAEKIEVVLLAALQEGSVRLIYREAGSGRLVLKSVDPGTLAVLGETEIKPQ
ncbi:MAG: hypothetical protein ACR2PM_08490 [Hyphomicrobiales bacterium]